MSLAPSGGGTDAPFSPLPVVRGADPRPAVAVLPAVRKAGGGRYRGWYRRPRGRWQPVVDAATEAEAWQRLLAFQTADQFCEKTVLEEGRKP